MKRALAAAGLALALAACGTSQAAEPPAKAPPATIYTTQWTSGGYPESWFVCWTSDYHTWIGSPSRIPSNAINVRPREDCDKP